MDKFSLGNSIVFVALPKYTYYIREREKVMFFNYKTILNSNEVNVKIEEEEEFRFRNDHF